MLKYDDKAILYNPDAYKRSGLIRKIRAWWWDSWLYGLYEYSWAYKLRWHVTHWWKKDNWIKTNLPIGYSDKVLLMEDGLFSMVENYIANNKEGAFDKVVIEDELRDNLIQIVHFYRIRKPELQERYDMILDALYGEVEMIFRDPDDEERTSKGYKILEQKYHGSLTEDQREDLRKYLREIEVQIFEETQEMLKKCIDVRPYLWT